MVNHAANHCDFLVEQLAKHPEITKAPVVGATAHSLSLVQAHHSDMDAFSYVYGSLGYTVEQYVDPTLL